ncbi:MULTISPECIES: PQQ-dependent sugar dehydrogenase [Planktothrix]|uniref:Glucose/sorbosone dehydrogenase n=1 Tax=Planktothrix rubescens CCAP 1459/22 TaxID=329571 RepID=A0A6J7ZN44_PLARU|nr:MULTISPECIES: sorbosone dehydrogenase family protein [Planktothrix]CAC5343950.1 Glucose/sorbosone dehydrogenase [Planktothrix rubescens NIVA-CYA 18]CAD5914203.1 L-sorbosone dehydrogenase [Planktothrix agardhii]CAD5982056.1 L-sorbosone dehydrogenase [Planktothrix rubescens NIVA-CYA 18]
MSKLGYFPLLFLGLLIGCQQNSDRIPTNSSISVAIETQNNIIIKPLSPQPIRINLEDLPPPFHSESASKPPQVIPIPNNPVLNVPPGFKVNIFAENLDNPRWLALTPDGDVLVTETKQNRIRLLKDTNKDGVADQITTFADSKNGLNIPFGMAFSPGYFFLGNTDEVRRYSYNNQQQLTGTGEKIAELPGGGYNQHWTRNVVVSPDNQKLYVSIGSKTNVSEENPPRASIQVMNLDGSNQQTFAYGLRNPVGLDFHPETKELYTTVNERDGLGDDLVPDYFTRIRSGEFYGWPYSYFTPNNLDPRHVQNGQSVRPDLVKKTLKPDVLFQAHSAALGLQFYDGNTFPEPYKKGAFVAFRGSWNRNSGTGYKLVFIPFNQGRPQGYYEEFLTGFLVNPAIPETWGRPVGLLVLPDGSLIFTEESNGRIYRVQYSP